ncbi:MAG: 8-oxoguanine deaminase, partial [Acidiferrobacteraceae bacterium]|nr:8-oxoguanine deaminase [Acidiferrobacteraceae bacterium]MBT6787690.1 8-oxoguanine deaminase [Acidiferrobacteraceae bacterium]
MSRLWIQDPLAIFAQDATRGVVIEGHRIAELIATGQKPLQPVDAIFDASNHVVLPGLINTHHHFYQTLTRALAPALGKELFDWLKALYPVWAGLDPELLAVATELALAELLLSGCTTTSDHHYLYPPGLEQALDIQVGVASHIGMRVTLTRGSMDLSQKDGGLPPDSVVQDAQTILADCERVVNAYHQSDPGAMVQVALAPCSPFSVSDPLMRESAALASKLQVRLHTHLGETRDENDYCLARLGMRPLDYLEECGWLGSHTWLAHGIHFTDDEIRRLGQAGTAITHCPHSNMTLASGLCPACALESAGSPVGLGVDGSASNDASNAIEEVRAALMLQRLREGAGAFDHIDALRLATQGSARCLGRDDIGTLEAGKQADLALFKLDELRHSGYHDPLAALVLCGASRADRVMIGGEWKVIDARASHIDEADLIHRHSNAAQVLRTR